MTAPLHLDGPHYSRRARITRRFLRAFCVGVITAGVLISVVMAATVAYALYLLATGY